MSGAPLPIEVQAGRMMRRQIERALSLALAVFGLALIVEPGTFDTAALYQWYDGFPQSLYGATLFGIGAVRLVVLIVNGHWPVGPHVRFGLGMASLFAAWIPFTLCYAWLALRFVLDEGGGSIQPGVVLAPVAAWVEMMCCTALWAWVEELKGQRGWRSTLRR